MSYRDRSWQRTCGIRFNNFSSNQFDTSRQVIEWTFTNHRIVFGEFELEGAESHGSTPEAVHSDHRLSRNSKNAVSFFKVGSIQGTVRGASESLVSGIVASSEQKGGSQKQSSKPAAGPSIYGSMDRHSTTLEDGLNFVELSIHTLVR